MGNIETNERNDRESQKNFWDLFSVKETAEHKGWAKGRAEGRAEGIMEVAKKMKEMGIAIETIIQSTGLSQQDIAAL